MIGSFVTGLKQYPGIADSLGLLSRSMRTDALPQIYEYIYRTKPVIASRKIDLAEFVYVFSNCNLGKNFPLQCLSTTNIKVIVRIEVKTPYGNEYRGHGSGCAL